MFRLTPHQWLSNYEMTSCNGKGDNHMTLVTLLHYGSLPFTPVVGSESRPSSRGIFVT